METRRVRWILAAIAVLLLQMVIIREVGLAGVFWLLMLSSAAVMLLVHNNTSYKGPSAELKTGLLLAAVSQVAIFLPTAVHHLQWQAGLDALARFSDGLSAIIPALGKIAAKAASMGSVYDERAEVIRDTYAIAYVWAFVIGSWVVFMPAHAPSAKRDFFFNLAKPFTTGYRRWPSVLLFAFLVYLSVNWMNEPSSALFGEIRDGRRIPDQIVSQMVLQNSGLHWLAWFEVWAVTLMGPFFLKTLLVTKLRASDPLRLNA